MNEPRADRRRLLAVGVLTVSIVMAAAVVIGRLPAGGPGEAAGLSAVGLAFNEGVEDLLHPMGISDPTAPTETTFDWYRIRGEAPEGFRIRVYRDRDRDGVADSAAPLGMTTVAPSAAEFEVKVPLAVGEHLLMLTMAGAGGERTFSIPAVTRIAVKDWCDCLPGVVEVRIARGASIESVLEGIDAAEVKRGFPGAKTLKEGGSLTEDRLAHWYYVSVAPGNERAVMAKLRRNQDVEEVGRSELIRVG